MNTNEENLDPKEENVEVPDTPETDNLSTEETVTDEMEEEPAKQEEKETVSEEKKEEKRGFFGKKNRKEEELKKKVEELEEQKKELNNKYLHLYSEFDNYKKRTNREKLELIETASEKVILNAPSKPTKNWKM